jgi:hypothetical protein
MLKVSSGIASVKEETSAFFDNCLPQNNDRMKFQWRYYSEEFQEWCDSIYQDRFIIQLIGAKTTFTALAVSVKELCPPSACQGCGTMYQGLTKSDIQFDQGDAWVTPWITTEVDIGYFMKQNGGKFRIKIFTTDAGDGIYDTVVLTDNILFYECQPDCIGKDCGSDGCGGLCGECPSWETCDESTGKCSTNQEGCTQHTYPGCGGCSCEDCVCNQDPYCCSNYWDDVCVMNCIQCGGCNGCIPDCYTSDGQKKQCGDDGCGGSCGQCPPGSQCNNGFCSSTQKTCSDILDCAINCGMDYQCAMSCQQGASQQSQQLFMSLIQCAIQGCGFPPDYSCIIKSFTGSCSKQYQACIND